MTIYNPFSSFVNGDYPRPDASSSEELPFSSYDPSTRLLKLWDDAVHGLVSYLSEISARLEYEVSLDGELAALINALSKAPIHPLSEIDCLSGIGGGLYAIYYTGSFPDYRQIAIANTHNRFSEPIYIGKTAKGARKGGLLVHPRIIKSALHARMRTHQKSIISANNLKLEDFYYRVISCTNAPVSSAEEMLIMHFHPLWNCTIDGFSGDNARGGTRSLWDSVHPGRPWAAMKADRKRFPNLGVDKFPFGMEPALESVCDDQTLRLMESRP